MSLRSDAMRAHPHFPWLDPERPAELEGYLRERGWLAEEEQFLACERAGEGNMNLTLRVRTERRSLILKQARPWVEKYDHIAAPWDRARMEQRFYERVAAIGGVAERMPRVLGSDPNGRVLVLEDLGEARDLTNVYGDDALAREDIDVLAEFVATLHAATHGEPDPSLANREMRKLNHEHIYVVPVADDNGLPLEELEPGLGRAAAELREDPAFRSALRETGERYLADGPVLVHGDYFPGSWLRTAAGLRVIDPEFCVYGDAEIDVGCALAHLSLARQERGLGVRLLESYARAPGAPTLDATWTARFAAAEVMRRLIGVAQLPIPPSRDLRRELLKRSRRAMTGGAVSALWEG
jgi:5-methylthioribose kinase